MNGLLIGLLATTALWAVREVPRVEGGRVVPVALRERVSRSATAPLEVVTIPYVEKIVIERTGKSAPEFAREIFFSPKEYNADPETYTAEFSQRYPGVKFWVQKGWMHLVFESLPQGTYRILAKRRGGMERVKYNVQVPSSSPVFVWLDPLTGP